MIDPCCAPDGPHKTARKLKQFAFNTNIHDDFDKVLNNDPITNLRQSMLVGEKNPLCDTCWINEKNTGHSERTIGNASISKSDEYKKTIDFSDILFINMFLGNKCNLACRMCNPWCSSLVAKQTDIINRQQYKPAYEINDSTHPRVIELIEKQKSIINRPYNRPAIEFDDRTQQRIIEFIDKCENLEKIHMYGGEPLVNDFHDIICSHLIDKGRASKITLGLSTNLQVDLERKNELYSHFKNVNIQVSIDGEGDTYEYIRWPGNWNKIQNNLTLLSDSNSNFGISTVIQNLNIDNLVDLLLYLNTIPNFSYHSLTYRKVSTVNDIKIIPTWVLEREIGRLENLKLSGNHDVDVLIDMLVAELEPSRNLEYKEVADFFKQQKGWDSIRNQNLFSIKPHFLELAKQFNIEPW